MKYFYFLSLIIGALSIIGVRCDKLEVIRIGEARDLAEGYAYEQFSFLAEINVDSKNVKDELYWNTCSNYTGINLFLNKTESTDCLGEVIDCRVSSVDREEDQRSLYNFVFDVKKFIEISTMKSRESCVCVCNRLHNLNDSISSTRGLLDSICLDEVSVDVKNNNVLTGVRLHRLNNTITFQVQQGKVVDGVTILETFQWIPLPKKCNKIGKLTVSKRTLILDDVILPESMIVTGVAFKRYSDVPQNKRPHPESPEVLETDPFFVSVIGHNINLMDNTKAETSVWNYSLENRTNLIVDDMIFPTALPIPLQNQILSKPEKNYISLKLTRPEEGIRKFVAPYVDIQDVINSNYPGLVRGIGLYYKGYEDYGGYIAPSIFYTTH